MPNDIPASPEGLVVYCRSWCGDCARARAWLEERGIPYTEIDVELDPEARAYAESLNDGRLHTPTFTYAGGCCVDFDVTRLCALLGVE